jgi:hypothetical protein
VPDPDFVCRKLRRFEPDLLQRWLQLPGEHRGLVDEIDAPEPLLWRLCQLRLWPEAVRMLAYTLPEREAVWWSCMCVRHSEPTLPAPERGAVEAAEAWVRKPEPELRREAALAASASGYSAPGAWSALAAVWSHRKKLLPDLCGGRGAATAVMRAAGRNGPERQNVRLRQFVQSGIDVGNGGVGRLPREEVNS